MTLDAARLVNGYLDETLSPDEHAALSAWLNQAPENAQKFAEALLLHDRLRGLHFAGAAGVMDEAQRIAGRMLSVTADPEWFIQEVPLRDDQARQLTPLPSTPLAGSDGRSMFDDVASLAWTRWGLAFAVLTVVVVTLTFGVIGTTQPPAARLIATAHPVWQGAEKLALGENLTIGKPMRLERGAVEFKFPGSATVVICGPAEFQMLAVGRVRLASGELTARVPPRAAGFVIEAPGLLITDLGTEFAVKVESQGVAQVTVLQGQVEVEFYLNEAGAHQRLPLTAGNSLRRADLRAPLVPVPAPAIEDLPRDIAGVRVPLELHGTGVGLRPGDADAAWQLISVPDDPNWNPQAAFVDKDELPRYMPNDPARSQWLLRTPNVWNNAHGHYVFAYSFNIGPEIDPRTVVVRASVVVDNAVRAVRLNGQETGQQTPPDRDRSVDKFTEMVFDAGFVVGVNRLEFDAVNLDEGRLSFRVALEGSGCLTARRLGDRAAGE